MAFLSSSHIARPARRSLISLILDMIALRNERRRLASLSDDELNDIGLSRAEAEIEASRSIWDLPCR